MKKKEVPIHHVNGWNIELVGNEYVFTIGASNQRTMKLVVGRGMLLQMIFKAAEVDGLEIPVVTEKPEAKQFNPWIVK